MNDTTYCYPNSDVLINKLNIRDGNKLYQAEKQLTMLRLLELQHNPVKGNFNLTHLCNIHQYIFQDLYTWAGQIRTVDIAKENLFCKVEFIYSTSEEIFSRLHEDFRNCAGRAEVLKKLSYYFSEINALHPFREGNGRAQREFVRLLAQRIGYDIDFSKTSMDEMLTASKASFLCDYAPMEKLFDKCLILLNDKDA